MYSKCLKMKYSKILNWVYLKGLGKIIHEKKEKFKFKKEEKKKKGIKDTTNYLVEDPSQLENAYNKMHITTS